ncbi:hypothetical protein D5047_20765 [Verminephrobacter eiseniae]|nr:hypothetical protein [Verminephrobacter eiseniae]
MMTPQTRRSPLRTVLTIATVAMLAACGGGGGGGGDGSSPSTPATTIDPVQFKGRWATAAAVTPVMIAVVLPDASGTTASAWLLANDASRLVKLVLFSDSSANGTSYTLAPTNTDGQSVTGTVTGTLTSSPKRMSLTGVSSTALAFDQSDALTTAAVQADAAKTWESIAGGNARTTTWTVASDGAISGSSTTGCSFTGKLTAMSSSNAFSAQFAESCSDGVTTNFSGIATVDAPKTRLTVTAITADTKKGVAIFFGAKAATQ